MKFTWLKVLWSNRLTTVLLLLFAIAMAFGTFLENDFGTPAVQTTVYRAWWFELILLLLGINFIGNIFRYRLYRKEKLPILTFHVAFIIILIGAFITRYVSFEGNMHIREGAASNEIISQDRYLTVKYLSDGEEKILQKKLSLSYFTQPDFNFEIGSQDNPVRLIGKIFVPHAEQRIIRDPGGRTVLTVVTSGSVGRENLYLQSGGKIVVNDIPITLNNPTGGAINIFEEEGLLKVQSPEPLSWMVMASQTAGTLKADTTDLLKLRALYRGQRASFVIPEVHYESKVVYVPSEDKERAKTLSDMLYIDIETDSEKKEIALRAFDRSLSRIEHVDLGGQHLDLTYGPKTIQLPFSLELRDFQLERYPGSVSPSSYASEITVVDGNTQFPFRIFMNNVLDYKGYRFFQASYDTDERGTILSVNKDYWGTLITYIGYTLMGLGMMLTLFGKNSRFQFINRKLSKLNQQAALVVFFLLVSGIAEVEAQDIFSGNAQQQVVNKEHAERFGRLLVQDLDGRIKPINTLSSEFLRKVHGRSSFQLTDDIKLNNDQLFLIVNANPLHWQTVPIIKIDAKKTQPILELLGQSPGTELLRFTDLIDNDGNYLLQEKVQEASQKKPAERSAMDDELIKVDERFNVYFQGLTGHFLKVFPLEDDPANTWFNDQIPMGTFHGEDSVFVVNVMPVYFGSVIAAARTGDWLAADENLGYIRTFQEVKGKEVIPPINIQKAEVLYNKLKLFNHLFGFFWIAGLFLLVIAIVMIFSNSRVLEITYWVLTVLIGLGFLVLTFNLLLRWYAAQYPPWSNGYEMIILVAWSILLFAFLFIRKSKFVVALGALFTGTLLFVAFLDWLNPEITNLVPVLKSYWLKIHVAIIVSSYAPLALSALLGLLALLLMIWDKQKNPSIERSIKELTYINEMSMTIGLFMLAIGTFLGGVWANESWGRYWGWDPKETWALISVIIYAAVLHLRLIPKLNDLFVFNTASVWAFFSIIMTSFGVNYYLAGLHSYAKGDPVPIPQFIYWVVGILLVINILAYRSYKRTDLGTEVQDETD